MNPRRVAVVFVLQIVRQYDRGWPALGKRDSDSPVNHVPNLRRRRSLLHISTGNVLEHRNQVELLLVLAAQRVARLLPGNRQHGLVIEQRIVQPGDQVRGARAGRCDADSDVAAELRIGARHERRHFLMARLDELRAITGAVERLDHTVDAIAGIAEDVTDAPFVKTGNNEIADGARHDV